MSAYQLVDKFYGDGVTTKKLPISGLIEYVFDGADIIDTDENLDGFVDAGALASLTDAEVTAQGGATTTVTPVQDAADAAGSALEQVASDGALALTSAMGTVYLDESTTGAKAITTAASRANQIVSIFLAAASGGSYTLAVDGGTLTFNAALQFARIKRNAQNTAWEAIDLIGATVV